MPFSFINTLNFLIDHYIHFYYEIIQKLQLGHHLTLYYRFEFFFSFIFFNFYDFLSKSIENKLFIKALSYKISVITASILKMEHITSIRLYTSLNTLINFILYIKIINKIK